MSLLNKLLGKKESETEVKEVSTETEEQDTVSIGTKIKVLAALLVVGFAVYIAWWVQDPSSIKADLLGADTPTQQTGTQAEPQTAQVKVDVTIKDFAYAPETLNIEKGTMVTWTNKDSVPHTVTISGTEISSGTLNSEESFSYVFEDEGTYEYSCSFHPQMQGTVVVGNPSATAATTTQATEATLSPETLAEVVSASTQTIPLLTSLASSTETAEISEENKVEITEEELTGDSGITQESVHLAANEDKKQLAKSGPEDLLYVLAIGVILYINRRKLLLGTR